MPSWECRNQAQLRRSDFGSLSLVGCSTPRMLPMSYVIIITSHVYLLALDSHAPRHAPRVSALSLLTVRLCAEFICMRGRASKQPQPPPPLRFSFPFRSSLAPITYFVFRQAPSQRAGLFPFFHFLLFAELGARSGSAFGVWLIGARISTRVCTQESAQLQVKPRSELPMPLI